MMHSVKTSTKQTEFNKHKCIIRNDSQLKVFNFKFKDRLLDSILFNRSV